MTSPKKDKVIKINPRFYSFNFPIF